MCDPNANAKFMRLYKGSQGSNWGLTMALRKYRVFCVQTYEKFYLKDYCCKFNIIDENIKECSFEQFPHNIMEAYLIWNISHESKNKEAKAYKKILDEIVTTGQNFNFKNISFSIDT